MRALFSKDREQELVAEYLQGHSTLNDISLREGCHLSTIHKIIRQHASADDVSAARSKNHAKAKSDVPRPPEVKQKISDTAALKQVARNCLFCGGHFLCPQWRAALPTKGKYCSIKCYQTWQKTQAKVPYTCRECGEVFLAGQSRPKSGRALYCSHKCRGDWKRKITGDKTPNWKGGITKKSKAIRNLAEYREWRTAVYKRDDYTCQRCNIRGGSLEAHHIQPFSTHPELRLTVDNGITYCTDCHGHEDQMRGRLLKTPR